MKNHVADEFAWEMEAYFFSKLARFYNIVLCIFVCMEQLIVSPSP